MKHALSIKSITPKEIRELGDDFRGENGRGESISFTNYYMQKNGRPFLGVSGEFHFSRMSDERWEDELIKMKLGGINVVTTYVFWIHHEEEEGRFDFSRRRDIRRFVQLCAKHGLYVILRVGPFAHGEVRNGGLPDWLYGKPFEVRKLSEGFLYYTGRFYYHIGKQVEGLFYRDGGPVIGVQIDNEYMHSSAAWEMTTGISDEWIFSGDEGDAYMLRLKELAAECGLTPVFYTCTAWGGAIAPDSMMPLWGGYSYRPWIFYTHKGDHPATEEYIYQDFHHNGVMCTNDFKPRYQPEDRPYACCEMGGGMMCSYYYRFRFNCRSVDAMANIKLASGCNFLGYYMFHGGSNPIGRGGVYLNEAQVPKISYDYQAALGEFGQVRESYRRLKSIHYFAAAFGERLCPLRTVLPAGASQIDPRDMETLRYAVRTDGKSGFLFINNFQDHMQMPIRKDEEILLELDGEEISFRFDIAADENAILPFHFDMDGIDLISATAQPVTVVEAAGERTYVFMIPEGMEAAFRFEDGAELIERADTDGPAETDGNAAGPEAFAGSLFTCRKGADVACFRVRKGGKAVSVLVLSREMANQMYPAEARMGASVEGASVVSGLIFTQEALLADENGLRLETCSAANVVYTYPAEGVLHGAAGGVRSHRYAPILGCFRFDTEAVSISPKVTETAVRRYTVALPAHFMDGLKDARLQINYSGDIGHVFIGGRMISDNFANGAVWEIGLKDFVKELEEERITIYITPLKEGASVNVESAMAARREEVDACVGGLEAVRVEPVYEIRLDGSADGSC